MYALQSNFSAQWRIQLLFFQCLDELKGTCFLVFGAGPQDHGWCAGYTCQKRVSLFHSIVATNKSFDIFFTSTTPQKLRLMLLNADTSKVSPTEAR